jgi:coenzyme F420 hydrogenase subunit beta
MNDKAKLIETCREYCTGCGLCGSVINKKFTEDDKHFLYPDLRIEDYEFCKAVCPAAGNAVNKYSNGTIWGNIQHCCLGWSNDKNVRHRASSGGVITAICTYLLEEHLVDGIIQVKRDKNDQRKTVSVVSTTKEQVEACSGSRYTTSSPLMDICAQIQDGKKYAFVGKPCDISSLRMLMNTKKYAWTEQILYLFSFFCAGQPSLAANNKLLAALGCKEISECQELNYRGNGWPGHASATLSDGKTNEMDYEKSWMTILGRDVRKCCRFCADGTGEMADISCGDAWYLTPDEKPDFEERPGRNVVFARTEKGNELLKLVVQANAISVEEYDIEKDKLVKSQPYHYNRKASLSSLKLAAVICRKRFPLYSNNKMKMFAKGFPVKSRVLRCVGTIKRIWSGVI